MLGQQPRLATHDASMSGRKPVFAGAAQQKGCIMCVKPQQVVTDMSGTFQKNGNIHIRGALSSWAPVRPSKRAPTACAAIRSTSSARSAFRCSASADAALRSGSGSAVQYACTVCHRRSDSLILD